MLQKQQCKMGSMQETFVLCFFLYVVYWAFHKLGSKKKSHRVLSFRNEHNLRKKTNAQTFIPQIRKQNNSKKKHIKFKIYKKKL